MSAKSFTSGSPLSELTPEEIGKIQMAQVALISFMGMLVPEESKHDAKHESYGTMPSLETVRDSESHE
jgi:hypothetical protein